MNFTTGKLLTRAAVLAAALALGGYGCSVSCGGHNESAEALRSVPVPLEVAAALPGAAASTPDENAIVRQSYTLSPDGQFTFNRSVEAAVGSIGATFVALDPVAAARWSLEPYSGVVLLTVEENGPAGTAGLKPDDVLVSFGESGVASVERLEHLIETGAPGTRVEVTVRRGEKRIAAVVTLGAEKRIVTGRGMQQKLPVRDDLDRTGLRLAELTPEARAIILGPNRTEPGLLVLEVLPGGPGFCADLRVKDYIVGAEGERVAGLDDYAGLVGAREAGTEVALTVQRGDQTLEVPLAIVEDARAAAAWNVLNLVKWQSRPEKTHFSLIFSLLFTYDQTYCVKKADSSTRNVTRTGWGTTLDLIMCRSTSGGRKELRLLWLFPISWGGS